MKLEDAVKQVGLAKNVKGVAFRCGTCKFFDNGECYNPHPKLYEKKVDEYWCCNLYNHKGMEVIIT